MKRQATSTPVRKGYDKKPRRESTLTIQSKRVGGYATYGKSTGERKFIDTDITTTIGPNTNQFSVGTLLNGLQLGSSASQRIGRKVVLKSILIRYNFAVQNTTTWATPVRILVVYDKQANGSAPAITDILLTDHISSQNNLSNKDRFVTIFDHMTGVLTGSSADSYIRIDNLYKKLNLETMYNANDTGLIGDIASGSLYVFFGSSARLQTAGLVQDTRVRVRYTDV